MNKKNIIISINIDFFYFNICIEELIISLRECLFDYIEGNIVVDRFYKQGEELV